MNNINANHYNGWIDYHVCESKYSREARLLVPSGTPLDTCGDIAKLFPGIGVQAPEFHLEYSPGVLWWVWKHHGFTEVTTQSTNIELYTIVGDEY